MRIPCLLITMFCTLLATPRLAAQVVVYSNFSNSLNLFLNEGAAENGDQIHLAPGTPRTLQDFTFQYWMDPAKFTGTETVRIRFYANDGPALGPTDPTPTPGTLLYDSGTFPLKESGQARETLPQLNIAVPDTFTWTAQFAGGQVSAGGEGGVILYSPPSVGSNQPEFWQKDSTGWNLYYFEAYATDFGAEITAVAQPPVLAPVPSTVIAEGTLLTITLTGSDPDPKAPLAYSLVSGPSGMSVDPDSGLLTWTPTEGQGPGQFNVTVQVADKRFPALLATRTFTLTVREVNSPPSITPIPNQSVAQGGTMAIPVVATDPDLPPNKLTFSLDSGPSGARIDPGTGLVTWTPAPGQGANFITVRVTDDGTPPLSDTKTFRVTVTQQFPTDLQLGSLGTPDSVVVGTPLQYSMFVTNRGPAAVGGIVLRDTIPAGATVNSATASQGTFLLDNSETVFTLGSLEVGAGATVTLTVTPTVAGVLTNHVVLTSSVADLDPSNNTLDQHTPATSGLVATLSAHMAAGQLVISWSSALTGFQVQYAQDLGSADGWHALAATPLLSGDRFSVTAPVSGGRRFYRLSR